MNFSRLCAIIFSVFCLSFISLDSGAQPENRPSEKEVQIEKVFIEASKEKMLGNYEDAIFLFNEVLHKDKGNHPSMYELAQLYIITKRDDKAMFQIEQAVKLDPDNIWYSILYADLNEKVSDYAKAAQIYDNLIKKYPDHDEFYMEKAYMLSQAKKYEEAVGTLDELEKKVGVSDDLSIHKYDLYMLGGMKDKAVVELEKLVRVYPTNIQYLLMLADFHKISGNQKAADEVFQKILKIDPSNAQASLAMAENYKANGDHVGFLTVMEPVFANPEVEIDVKVREMVPYIEKISAGADEDLVEEAIKITRLITEAHPGEAKAFSLHGDMLYHGEKSKEALLAYEKALELEKNVFTLWQQLFLIHSELSQFEELIKATEKSMDYFPNQPLAYFFNGLANAQLKEHKEAINMFKQALQMAGSNRALQAEIYVHLGGQYNATEQYQLSDEAFEKSLAIEGNNPMALNNYSYYLSVRGEKLDLAEQMARRANEMSPDQPNYQDTLGWVYYKQRRFKEAKTWIEKAIQNGGESSAQILENYGDVLYQLREIDEAVKYWLKAQETGSDSELLEKKISDRKLYE